MHLISTLWKWEIDFRLIYLNLPQSNVAPESYLNDLQNPVNKLTCFRDITQTEILNLLHGFVASKASGMDRISAKVLKMAAPVIAPSLALIFN